MGEVLGIILLNFLAGVVFQHILEGFDIGVWQLLVQGQSDNLAESKLADLSLGDLAEGIRQEERRGFGLKGVNMGGKRN